MCKPVVVNLKTMRGKFSHASNDKLGILGKLFFVATTVYFKLFSNKQHK